MSAADSPDDAGPQPTLEGGNGDGISRREAMRRVMTAATATAAIGAAGSQAVPQFSPAGRARAIPPAAIVLAPTAGAAVGWALREHEVIGADDPPEGMTPDALHESVYNSAKKRESNNASTFVDNRNIINTGLEHSLYADGKVAAIEALNDEKTEQEVEDAAFKAAEESVTTPMKNLLRSWNESVNELQNLITKVQDHSDLGLDGLIESRHSDTDTVRQARTEKNKQTAEFPNGDTMDVHVVEFNTQSGNEWSPYRNDSIDSDTGDSTLPVVDVYPPSDSNSDKVVYLKEQEWTDLYDEFETVLSDVKSGLQTWVSNVYGEVQSGEIDTSDLLTPREMAEISSDQGVNQGIADLIALNIPVDLEREATIEIEQDNGTVTISGNVALTDDSDGPIEAGETYNPADLSGDVYFTYDVAAGNGEWGQYETGVDGGVVTFTAEPFSDTEYAIKTIAGETATVTADDFSEKTNDSDETVWTVDISDQVETSITEVDTVEMSATTDDTNWETIQLDQSFTVVEITDSDGQQVKSLDFEQSEPQNDENYITQEEWEKMRKRNEELIQKYEESQNDGGWGFPSVGGFSDFSGDQIAGLAIIGVIVMSVVGIATNFIPFVGGK
ncbi:hypothetical protein [Halopiger xanaduensis]|uniref:Envelope protein N-terminal domain-containing protein n=1 Tax=Halopiger xanaduensis (strain DSM 18323 / JCM 14033 / SH-6) TaxID=797210 RepID=F8DBX7_HALXS|nr:hypothetical protein [Halopiger xanaduensis]AEH35953.1 hypothetical protein Halxa_1320 [Halopiger xanaduensis SH-6]